LQQVRRSPLGTRRAIRGCAIRPSLLRRPLLRNFSKRHRTRRRILPLLCRPALPHKKRKLNHSSAIHPSPEWGIVQSPQFWDSDRDRCHISARGNVGGGSLGRCNRKWFSSSRNGRIHRLFDRPALRGFSFGGYWRVSQAATLGKLMMNVRVRRVDGGSIGFGKSLIRNLLRVIDAIGLYFVGFLIAILSRLRQRLRRSRSRARSSFGQMPARHCASSRR